jgi:hypothetical protein
MARALRYLVKTFTIDGLARPARAGKICLFGICRMSWALPLTPEKIPVLHRRWRRCVRIDA